MFFKRKRPAVAEELKKPLYEVDSNRMVKVKCPYCLEVIAEIYFMKVSDNTFTKCPHCHKELKNS